MSKKIFLAVAVFALASCAMEEKIPVRYCPNVQIIPEFSRMTQMSGKVEESKIELIGYEGYCRVDLRGQTKAVIAPIFEVSRKTADSDEVVRFRYYTDTGENNKAALIGKEAYSVSVKVQNVGEKIMYQGDYAEVRIPNGEPGYPIKMGLVLSNVQYRYNRMNGLK